MSYGEQDAMKIHKEIVEIIRTIDEEKWDEHFPIRWPPVDPYGVVGGIISYNRNERVCGERYLKLER